MTLGPNVKIDASGIDLADLGTKNHSDLDGIGANDHHNQQHALSGSDHTGDLAYTQIDDIVKVAGGGSTTTISRSDHTHTGSDGSDNIPTSSVTNLEGSLLIGEDNAAYVPCLPIANSATTYQTGSDNYQVQFDSTGSVNIWYICPYPTDLANGLSLHVKGCKVMLQDADAGEYISDVLVFTQDHTGRTWYWIDSTNKTSPGEYPYPFDAHDCTGDMLLVRIACTIGATVTDLNLAGVWVLVYYA